MIRHKGKEPIREAVQRLDEKLWHQLAEVWRKAEEGIHEAQRSKDGHQQGTQHCLAVEENLSALIPDDWKGDRLRATDLFVLSAAAALHDVGKAGDTLDDHGHVSMREVRTRAQDFGLDEGQAEVVGWIVCAHNDGNLEALPPTPRFLGTAEVDVRALAALFKLADMLHTEYTRVSRQVVDFAGARGEDNPKTLFRLRVRGWGYDPQGRILLQATPKGVSDIEVIFTGFEMMRRDLEPLAPVLQAAGFPHEFALPELDETDLRLVAEAERRVHYRTLFGTKLLGHLECDGNSFVFIQEMLKQAQTQLKEAQIAPLGAMNQFAPLVSPSQHAQIDNPDVRQTRRNHQAGQTWRVAQMALVQMKPPTLLVREERLNPRPFPIPLARFFDRREVGQEINRFIIALLPPRNRMHGPITLIAQGHRGQTDQFTRLDADTFKAEFLVRLAQNDVLGGAADIVPPVGVNGALQLHPIELPVAQEDHLCPSGNQGVDLFQQGEVGVFGKVSLASLDDQPSDGQRPLLVDHADHQGQTAAPNGAPVHDQAEGTGCQTTQQGLDEGQEIDLGLHLLVVNPAREAFGSTVWMRAIGDMARYQRQVRTPAPHDATDQPGQGV